MSEMLQTIGPIFLKVCLPIFIMMGLGSLIDRTFRLDLNTLVKLNIYLFVPAFLFVKVVESPASGAFSGRIIGLTLGVIATMYVASWVIAKWRKEPASERKALQLSTMFYNCGNFGIPVTALAFPEMGPQVHVWVLMTMNLSTFSLGMLLTRSQSTDAKHAGGSWMTVFKQPSIVAILIALVVNYTGFDMESVNFIWKPMGFMADALVAFALVTLGVQLSQTVPPRIGSRLGWALGLRLVGGPVTAALLAPVFGFSGEAAAVLILGASAPTAINTALLAHEFKAEGGFAAAAVFYSTVTSIITVTIVTAILKATLA